MKIVADENIPLIQHYFGGQGELFLKPGRDIARADVIDADILLVRSVTKVDHVLLDNTPVKFVGSATSGADHLDTTWLEAHNIKWSVAEGCNAMAVAEYVVCVIAALQNRHFLTGQKVRAAVVGVGRIGQRVVDKFESLGFDVVLCDPFRADISSTSFAELSDLDFISFHTPLIRTGAHPTFHLVQKEFLQKQNKNCILLNAGRGEVFAFNLLKKYGQELMICLDVWEQEPHIDVDMLNQTLIATPHIAGYSLQSKYRGIEMIYRSALQQGVLEKQTIPDIIFPTRKISVSSAKNWRDVVLKINDPLAVTLEMKEKLKNDPDGFDVLRKKYADRYEFGFVELEDINLPEADMLLLEKWVSNGTKKLHFPEADTP